jgi:hypothetical protein
MHPKAGPRNIQAAHACDAYLKVFLGMVRQLNAGLTLAQR